MKIIKLILSIAFVLVLGFISSLFVNTNLYNSLSKPFFAPPSYLFGIVWTILYILMGITIFMIHNSKYKRKNNLIILYILQLIINIIWTLLFFKLKIIFVSFVWLLLLLLLVIFITIKLKNIDTKLALIQIPYILWLIFACVLNLSIYLLNR